MGLLSTFPRKSALRVYFSLSGNETSFSKDKLYNVFSTKCKGIINIIVESKGGHFIVNSTDSAEQLLKCEGDYVGNSHINFELETLEELLLDPLSEVELKAMDKNYQ